MKISKALPLLSFALLATIGCSRSGSNSTTGTPATKSESPAAIQVQNGDLSGTPTGFTGDWQGSCSVTGPGPMPKTCSVYLRINQDATQITIETGITLDGRSYGPDQHALVLNGNSLILQGQPVGQIGVDAFTYTSAGSSITFLRSSPGQAQFLVRSSNGSDSDTVYQADLLLTASP